MRYVPNIIPKHLKVLPDYFKGNPYVYTKKNRLLLAFSYIGAIFFILSSLAFIDFLPLFFTYGALGLILLPPVHYWLEKILRFQFTGKIKSVFCVLLILLSFPFIKSYEKKKETIATEQKQQQQREEQVRIATELKEQQRKDSFNYHLALVKKFEAEGKIDEASKEVETSLKFASAIHEKNSVHDEQTTIEKVNAIQLVKKGKYNDALPIITALLNSDPNNTDLLFNRAVCFHKTGKIQESVDDLKTAIRNGDVASQKYHDKINPVKRKIIGYTTLCCDGSTSSATGRGACSSHGGVCEWNHPIYEEYRKY